MTSKPHSMQASIPRTLYEMREEMRSIANQGGDAENDHYRADAILCEALRYLATVLSSDQSPWRREVSELIASWERVGKWYA